MDRAADKRPNRGKPEDPGQEANGGTPERDNPFLNWLATLVNRKRRPELSTLRGSVNRTGIPSLRAQRTLGGWYRDNGKQSRVRARIAAWFTQWHEGYDEVVQGQGIAIAWRYVVDLDRIRRDIPYHHTTSMEERFHAALTATDPGDAISEMISILRSYEVPIDWHLLHKDMDRWSSRYQSVQQRWQREYLHSTTDHNH